MKNSENRLPLQPLSSDGLRFSPDSIIHPFADDSMDAAGYFTGRRLFAPLSCRLETLDLARRLIEEIPPEDFEIKTDYYQPDEGFHQPALLARLVFPKENVEARLFASHEKLLSLRCTHPKCRTQRNLDPFQQLLCPHMTALVLLTKQHLKDHGPEDASTMEAREVLSSFAGLLAGRSAFHRLRLSPRLILEKRRLKLGFRVGLDQPRAHQYIIYSLSGFLKTMEEGGIYHVKEGISLPAFSEAWWTEESLPWLSLLKREVHSIQTHYLKYYPLGSKKSSKVPDSFLLSGGTLDDFFDLASGKMEILNRDSSVAPRTLNFSGTLSRLELVLTEIRDETGFHGLQLRGKLPLLLEGSLHSYFLTNETLTRLSKEATEAMRLLSPCIDENGCLEMQVGTPLIPDFFHQLLPSLEAAFGDRLTIRDKAGLLQRFASSGPAFFFELDVRDHRPVCKAYLQKGEERLPLLHLIKDRQAPDILLLERLHQILLTLFPETDAAGECYLAPEQPAPLMWVLQEGPALLKTLGELQCTKAFSSLRVITGSPELILSIETSESPRVSLSLRPHCLTFSEIPLIYKAWKEHRFRIRLPGGSVLFPGPWVEELDALMDTLGIDPARHPENTLFLPTHRSFLLEAISSRSSLPWIKDSSFRELMEEEPSDSLQVWLSFIYRYGLGGLLLGAVNSKTVSQLAKHLATLRKQPQPGSGVYLIVCPDERTDFWQRNLGSRKSLPTAELKGWGSKQKTILDKAAPGDIFFTTYQNVLRRPEVFQGRYYEYILLDEAENLLTIRSRISAIIGSLDTNHRLAMTGQDLSHRPDIRRNVYRFLMPDSRQEDGDLPAAQIFRL